MLNQLQSSSRLLHLRRNLSMCPYQYPKLTCLTWEVLRLQHQFNLYSRHLLSTLWEVHPHSQLLKLNKSIFLTWEGHQLYLVNQQLSLMSLISLADPVSLFNLR